MSQGDSLTIAASATMALILASRAWRARRGLPRKTAMWMAVAWMIVIVATIIAAAWWEG